MTRCGKPAQGLLCLEPPCTRDPGTQGASACPLCSSEPESEGPPEATASNLFALKIGKLRQTVRSQAEAEPRPGLRP